MELLAENEIHRRCRRTISRRSNRNWPGRWRVKSGARTIWPTARCTRRCFQRATRRRETTPESVKALTIQQVRDYHEQAFRLDLTTIVVIGNVTPERAQSVIAKYFGAWQEPGRSRTLLPVRAEECDRGDVGPEREPGAGQGDAGGDAGADVEQRGLLFAATGQSRAGRGFYASRLYRDLREKNGLVYFVGFVIQRGIDAAKFMRRSYVSIRPNVSKARAMIEADLRDMAAKKVTLHELQQAKVLILRDIPLQEASFDSVANGWLSRVELELPLDEQLGRRGDM